MDVEHSSGSPLKATFSALPVELLTKIIFESQELSTKRTLRELRWVCRVFSNVVRHRALEYLLLQIPRYPRQVEEMLAHPSTFETSARTLCLEVQHYAARAEQWKGLAELVQRMKGVRTIRWVHRGRLHPYMVKAISSLPRLEELDIQVIECPPGDSIELPVPCLAKLKSISLDLPCSLGISTSIGYLYSNSPALEHLGVRPFGVGPLSFEGIAAGSETQENPCLRSIEAAALALPTSATSMWPLMRLSSLEIPNNRAEDTGFWPALSASGIKLQTIKVEVPSSPLIEYLDSYRGLRYFRLGGHASDTLMGTMEHQLHEFRLLLARLLKTGLFEHRASLRDLRFHVESDNNATLESRRNLSIGWQISIVAIVGLLHRFRFLERLDFVGGASFTDPMAGVADVLDILPALSASIKVVCFTIFGLEHERYVNGQLQRGSSLAAALENLQQYRTRMPPIHWKALRLVIRALEPNFIRIPGVSLRLNRIVYRLDEIPECGTYGLKMDELSTELLNEEGARSLDEDAIL